MKEENHGTDSSRWYGPNDPVSLADVRQAGATGVVTALHHIPNGEVWSVEEILKRKAIVEDAGLVVCRRTTTKISKPTLATMSVTLNHQQTLRNLAQCGIRTVCYTMSVLDWTRTDLEYVLPDGSKLCPDRSKFAAFENAHPGNVRARKRLHRRRNCSGAVRFATMSDEDKARSDA
ncbi:mannonate dehydratase [Escherichia coli]|nr:mannonate dehydratase [Escherichia coli]